MFTVDESLGKAPIGAGWGKILGAGESCPRDGLERAWRLIGWLAGVTVVFQRMEPWAYEAVWAMGIAVAVQRRAPLPRGLWGIAALAGLNALGFFVSALAVASYDWHAGLWAGVSLYLAVTALLVALYVAEDPAGRLSVLTRALVLGGAVSTVVAVVGMASSGQLREFLMNGSLASAFFVPRNSYKNLRGVALFKDPNAYAAFMVLPVMVALAWTTAARGLRRIGAAIVLAFLAFGLLLATSRGAYVNLAVAVAAFGTLAAVFAPDGRARRREALALLFGCAVIAAATAAGVTFWDALREDVMGRAVANMPYDNGPFGRWQGISMALGELGRPLGLGPLQFWKAYVAHSTPERMTEYFAMYDRIGPWNAAVGEFWRTHPERTAADVADFWRLHASNPHDVYLDQFIAGGWLSGATYLALLLATALGAWRVQAARPSWARPHAALVAALAGACVEGLIIDTEHWRHFFLLLGAAWGGWAAIGMSRSRLPIFKDSSTFRQEVPLPGAEEEVRAPLEA